MLDVDKVRLLKADWSGSIGKMPGPIAIHMLFMQSAKK